MKLKVAVKKRETVNKIILLLSFDEFLLHLSTASKADIRTNFSSNLKAQF